VFLLKDNNYKTALKYSVSVMKKAYQAVVKKNYNCIREVFRKYTPF